MPTIADAVIRTKRLLNSNTRTELDAVHTTLAADATEVRLKHQTDGVRSGSYISVGDGTNPYETMYVHSRNGEYITVQRGLDGSEPTGGLIEWPANTSVIEVEPRFTGHQIHEALKDAINALPENLYTVSTTTVDFSTTAQAVSITFSNGFTQILTATRTARASEDRLLKFNVAIQEYPVGTYKLIRQEGLEKAVTVNLTYAHPFVAGTLDLGTDLVSTVGMSSEMIDIPQLGAAASLMLAEESTRLDLHAAGDSRGDGALSPGDRMRYSLVLQAQYDRRVSQEVRRLMAKYGVRADGAVSSVFPTTVR